MTEIREIFGIIFVVTGMFFFVVGIAGLVRFPDVYMRIHSSGKVSMLGMVSLLTGAAFLSPDTALKAIALIIFFVIGQPVASHAVASAAYRSGVQMHKPLRDDLAEALTGKTSPIRPMDADLPGEIEGATPAEPQQE